ncbi:MAG TPA: hypothetical protein VJ378_02380 [Candidatus Paceibacterota bacterium]|nr:hypothetical protein [Candidatus Paceibacterota bacterium]
MKASKGALRILGIFLIVLFTFNASNVLAGFGISPPYVLNDKLTRGSSYEQKIILSRGDPNEDLKAEITIDAPEIENWITIEPGKEFILPKGEQQVPMIVKVNVPKDAEYKNYKGVIRVRTSSLVAPGEGQVSIAIGARIDVDLSVNKEVFIDFKVRAINILPVEIKSWPLSLFNNIKVLIKIENLGNVKGSPTKVQLDLYDINEKGILESKEDKSLEDVNPFETKEISAEFPTKITEGQYWVKVKIFNGSDIKREEKIIITATKVPFSVKDWLIVIGSGILILVILLAAIYGFWRFKFKKKK